jgi:hypothetical protein
VANTATSGYHETITVFWIKVLDTLFVQTRPIDREKFAAWAVERYAEQRDLFRRFYDFDVVASTEAREAWRSPTLEEIEDSAATHLDIATQ